MDEELVHEGAHQRPAVCLLALRLVDSLVVALDDELERLQRIEDIRKRGDVHGLADQHALRLGRKDRPVLREAVDEGRVGDDTIGADVDAEGRVE